MIEVEGSVLANFTMFHIIYAVTMTLCVVQQIEFGDLNLKFEC